MERDSNRLWILKGLSIFSVVCAHVAYDSTQNPQEQVALNLLNNFGTIGVVVFFVLAGYFFSRKNEDAGIFWTKKVKHLVLPWLICGSLVYLHCFQLYNIHHWYGWYEENIKSFDPMMYIGYILGTNSLYYYMTMLFCCFIIFRLFRNYEPIIILITVFSLLFLVLVGEKVTIAGTPYLNPGNWLGYFGCGVILRKSQEQVYDYIRKIKWLGVVASFIGVSLLFGISDYGFVINYFHRLFIPFVFLQMMMLLNFSLWIEKYTKVIRNILIRIGKDSYYIYLLHMLMQTVPVKYLSNRGWGRIMLRPIVLIVLTELIILIFRLTASLITQLYFYYKKIRLR